MSCDEVSLAKVIRGDDDGGASIMAQVSLREQREVEDEVGQGDIQQSISRRG